MILVTGASGMLGKALVKTLTEKGEQVTGIGSADGDLRDASATMKLFEKTRPDIVYHTAAKVHGILGNANFPAEMFSDNMRINMNVIEAARTTGCQKFIGVSTVAAYPGKVTFPISEDTIWDGPPHGSEEFYGHAKRAMLAHLQSCDRQYGFDYIYALMTNLYGQEDRFDTINGHVIPSLVAKFYDAAKNGTPISIWGSGRARRDFLHIDDAADVLVTLSKAQKGVYNVASGTTVPIRTVVDILMEISGVKDVVWDSTKPDGQLDRSYDVSRIKALGFDGGKSLMAGLETTYRWYADNYASLRR